MSGLEIIILVAGGIYVTKKVRDRKRNKNLAINGALADPHGTQTRQAHGIPQLVDEGVQPPRGQQVPAEEEMLPAYTPPSQNAITQPVEKGDLPDYDEILRSTEELDRRNGIEVDVSEEVVRPMPETFARMTHNMRLDAAAAASPSEMSKGRAERWKIWKKEGTKKAA